MCFVITVITWLVISSAVDCGWRQCGLQVCHVNASCVRGSDGESNECKCDDGMLDVSHDNLFGFACKKYDTTGCDEGWLSVEGNPSCFHLVNSGASRSHSEAAEFCQASLNSNLASVFAREDAKLIFQLIATEIEHRSRRRRLAELTQQENSPSLLQIPNMAWLGLIGQNNSWQWVDHMPINGLVFGEFFHRLPQSTPEVKCMASIVTNDLRSWIATDCAAKLPMFVCRKDRSTTPQNVSKDKLYKLNNEFAFRSFAVVCCDDGYPNPSDNLRKHLLHFYQRPDEAVRYGTKCIRYDGHYTIPLATYHSKEVLDVQCKCKQPGVGRNCLNLPKCENGGHLAHSINLRCSCPGKYFGERCELDCKHGARVKNNDNRDECICQDLFYGAECDRVVCLNDGKIAENGRYCNCLPKYRGQHCEQISDFTGHMSPHSSTTSYLTSIGISVFVMVVLAASAYFFVARQRHRHGFGSPRIMTAFSRRHSQHESQADHGHPGQPTIVPLSARQLAMVTNQQVSLGARDPAELAADPTLPPYVFIEMSGLPPPPPYSELFKNEDSTHVGVHIGAVTGTGSTAITDIGTTTSRVDGNISSAEPSDLVAQSVTSIIIPDDSPSSTNSVSASQAPKSEEGNAAPK